MASSMTVPVIDVQGNNFKELWAAMVIAIRTSSFIAIDTVRKSSLLYLETQPNVKIQVYNSEIEHDHSCMRSLVGTEWSWIKESSSS